MPVVLEPPLTRSGPHRPPGAKPDEPLLTAPRYMRSRAMGRWHRPRSGIRHGHDGRATYGFWCGPYGSAAQMLTADRVPAGDLACGTCEGRAAGAGQDDWPIDGVSLIFSPRRLTPPSRCPGSRRIQIAEHVSGSVYRCLVCGDLIPARAGGSPYNPSYGLANHEPGPGLIPGCPFHAWAYLVLCEGQVVCECRTELIPA